MLRIGLTGGIAAGKSVASQRLAELGALVIDHDVLAREVVAPGTVGLEKIVERYGDGVVDENGALDREALGRIVFDDAGARADLNGIVHPEVRRLAAEREAAAGAADPEAVVVHDIPLLVDTGQSEGFHVLVVVDAPADLRVQRLVESRGMTREDAQRRVAAQVGDDERRAAADVVLDGAGTVEELRAGVDALWTRVRAEVVEELV
ncbi:dephospho-CoA kinase [Sanguibacter suaedae]|uniref:Dephospho-CoA kinase n=1 Tax=Sanguibacter suaedae TaxID=2795737 RepID=A0A934MDL8_9MICO|nr:dephospho-CoA kinase [Sanguibacter suaedae]MBI9114914.1 dephospho-CoA kinase [Sanguibacter suaedae]